MQHLDSDYGLLVRFDTGQDIDEPGYSCEHKPYEQTTDHRTVTDSAVSIETLNTLTMDGVCVVSAEATSLDAPDR